MLEALVPKDPSGCCWVGKIPSHGDFTSHNLASHSRERLLSWISHGLRSAAEAHFKNTWINVYLNTPIWHFSAGVQQQNSRVYGLLVPSFDNVNRLYPLLLVRVMASSGAGKDVEAFYPLYDQLHEIFVESGVEPHPNSQTREQIAAYHRLAHEEGSNPNGSIGHIPWDVDGMDAELPSRWWVQSFRFDEQPEPRTIALDDPAALFSILFSQDTTYCKQELRRHARSL